MGDDWIFPGIRSHKKVHWNIRGLNISDEGAWRSKLLYLSKAASDASMVIVTETHQRKTTVNVRLESLSEKFQFFHNETDFQSVTGGGWACGIGQ